MRTLEKSKTSFVPEIRKLRLDDFMFHGIVLATGLLISIFVFASEYSIPWLVRGSRSRSIMATYDIIQCVGAIILFAPSIVLLIWAFYVLVKCPRVLEQYDWTICIE